MFISEKTIEQQAQQLDSADTNYEQAIAALEAAQPHILAYLFSESFQYLTEEERAYLLYLTIVIYQSIQTQQEVVLITEEVLGQHEEANWERMEASSSKPFRQRLDSFFENTTQEDLLAFMEDSLVADAEDQEDFLTNPGREIIFVGLKTIMDSLLAKE